MTRYRRLEPPGSKYATAEGARRLREEPASLWRVHRPQVTRAVAEAAAQGDRSENAEYIYGKKQLREIDRRVRYLRKRLDGLVVVSRPPDDRGRLGPGDPGLQRQRDLTGRNIALFTDFPGYDPEIQTAAGIAGDATPYNFVQQGQNRTFILRINLGF